MAIHTSPVFTDFRGSVNRQLLFRQYGGKTVISKFPDRSKVVYSERQRQAQKRFSNAVSFARVVIKEPALKNIYGLKATMLGFRSAWNMAIAEFMSDEPLTAKKRKIRFDKEWLNQRMGWNVDAKLYKYTGDAAISRFQAPKRVRCGPSRSGNRTGIAPLRPPIPLVLTSINSSSPLTTG